MDRLIAYINREIKSREENLRSGNIVNYEQYKVTACEIRLLDALKTKVISLQNEEDTAEE